MMFPVILALCLSYSVGIIIFPDLVNTILQFLCHISNTRDSVSPGYHSSNTENRIENTTRNGVFLTKFEVFG